MKLVIDTSTDVLSLFLLEGPTQRVELVKPNIVFHYAENGQVAVIEVLFVSNFLGDRKILNLDLDLTPSREESVFEVDTPKLRKLLENLKGGRTDP